MRAFRDYAAKNGYLVARESFDEAESGRVTDRPQFRMMLHVAGRPESQFSEIIAWKQSLLTRTRKHAVAYKPMPLRRIIPTLPINEHNAPPPAHSRRLPTTTLAMSQHCRPFRRNSRNADRLALIYRRIRLTTNLGMSAIELALAIVKSSKRT